MVGNAAELIAKVNPDLSLRVFASKDHGPNIGIPPFAAFVLFVLRLEC